MTTQRRETPGAAVKFEYWCQRCDVGLRDVEDTYSHSADGHGIIGLPPRLSIAVAASASVIAEMPLLKALERINVCACYTQEDASAANREAMLQEIGRIAREALASLDSKKK